MGLNDPADLLRRPVLETPSLLKQRLNGLSQHSPDIWSNVPGILGGKRADGTWWVNISTTYLVEHG